MAELYLAVVEGLRGFTKLVVLKRIRPGLEARADVRGMLLDEARLASRFGHRNLVDVIELDQHEGHPYYVMRYVAGADLRATLGAARRRGQRMPLSLAVHIATEIAHALHHAHELRDHFGRPLGVVHRDVSTANVRLGLRGEVALLDFGVAKNQEQHTRTKTGTSKGNAAYMAPEQCRGHAVDCRTDVFALGIVLYEMITMQRLFRGGDAMVCMHQVLHGEIQRPRETWTDIPTELERIVLRALERDPAMRFPSARAMADALEHLARRQGWCETAGGVARFVHSLFEAPAKPCDEIRERPNDTPVAIRVREESQPTSLEPSHPGTAPSTSSYGAWQEDQPTRVFTTPQQDSQP